MINHDWVSCNGIQPLQIHFYPTITLNPSDATLAIQRVLIIAKIRLRFKAKVKEQKQKRLTLNLASQKDSLD